MHYEMFGELVIFYLILKSHNKKLFVLNTLCQGGYL